MPENLFKPKRAPTNPIVDQPVSQPVVAPVEPAPRVVERPAAQAAPKPPAVKPVSKPVVAPAAKPAGRVELEELRFVPTGPVAPTGQDFELSQEDTKELLTRLRSAYEKSPATYDQQVAPTLIGFSKERGITPADLMAGAARAGSDLQEIRRVAGQEYGDPELRMTGEAAVNQALTVLGSRNLLPSVKTAKEAGQRATIRAKERSVVDMLPEEDRQRKAAKEQQLALQAPTFAPAAETYAFGSPVASDDPEVAKGEEAERARLIVEAIPPARRLKYTTGMDRLSSDSLAVMKESAEQIVGAEGVLMVINGEPINFRSTDARSILAEMKKQGLDLSRYGDEASQLEAAGRVGNEVLRRAFARSLNELAALRTVNGITTPIRLRIPYQKLAGIARSGEFDPMKEQPLFRPEDLEMTPEQIMEREGLSGLPDALLLATAPMTEIVGFKAGGAPGESQQAALLRQQSATETWFDRASMMYPWLKQTTMNGPVRMTDEGLTMIGPSEYLGEVLGGMQRRESAFEDIANSEKVRAYVNFVNRGPDLYRAIGMKPPSMYQLDYNGDDKIDGVDMEQGWRELKADSNNLIAMGLGLGAEVVSPDLFDVAGPILSTGARGSLRAIRYNPSAVKVLRDEAAALADGDLETAASKARELGYRQGVSQEKSALDAEAVSSGNAPELANAAIVVDSVVAQEMRLAGQADEMFDTKLIESLPVVKVEGAGETVLDVERRQGYQHGSLRVKDDEDAMVKEGRRSRYGYKQALADLDAMEAAVKRGEGHFPEQVKAATKDLLAEAKTVNKAAGLIVDTAAKLIQSNRAGEAVRMSEIALKAANLPDPDIVQIMAKIKEAADKAVATNAKALTEAPAAIERARKGVMQQAASRQRAVQELADFAEGVNGRGRVGRWMNKNLPAIDRQLARFRKPGDFKAFVTRRSLLDAAASMTVEQRKAKVKAALDGVESARKRRAAAEVAALKATASNDQAAIDKANKAIDAARERLVKAHEAVAAAITDGTVNGLSAGGHRLLARLVDAFDDRFNDVELAATAVQYEGRAKKMVEDGLAGSTDEWLDSIDFTTATAVPTGSVDEVLLAGRPISSAFYSGLRAAVEKFGDKPLTVESVIAQLKKQPAVKADELHWTRLSDFLAGKKTVSKQEMLDWLDEHAVVINVEGAVASGYDEVAEVERVFTARMEEARRRGASDDEIDEIDAAWDKANADAYRRYLARIRDRSYRSQYHEYTLPGESTNYAEITFTSPMAKGWDAPHFGQSERDKDLLFHMRVNERELPDGRRVLFVEEIQSDWHQSGRSQGYRGQGLPAEVEQRIQAKTQARMAEADRKYAQQSAALSAWGEARTARIRWEAANPMPTPPAELTPENRVAWRRAVAEWRDNDVFSEERAAWDRLREAASDEVGAEPTMELRGPVGREKIYLSPYTSKGHTQADLQDNFAARRDNEHRLAKMVAETAREKALAAQPPMAPFADNWHEYAFKYALRLAAERGLDGVAWTTGIQQTARYSDQLRQVVDKIEWKALPNGSRQVIGHKGARKTYQTTVGPDGFILNPGEVDDGKRLSEVLSGSMAKQIMGSDEGLLEGDNLTIGGQGMQAFYDERLPGFARKYARGQGWGVDVEKISLDKPASFVTVDDVTDWEEAEALVDRARALAVRSVPADRLAWVDFYEDIQRETPVSRAWARLPKRLQTAENADKIGLPARMVTGKPSADRVVHLLPLNEKAKDDILYRGQTLFQPATAVPVGSADEVLESSARGDRAILKSESRALPEQILYQDDAPVLPPTIKVDGIERPTLNAAGRPIHPTAEGVENFWRWFGDSKVVDEQGRPLVVYHGTPKPGHAVFIPRKVDEVGSGEALLGAGVYFSRYSDVAAGYAKDGAVYPVYLRLRNPRVSRTPWPGPAVDLAEKYLSAEHSPRYAAGKIGKLSEGSNLPEALPPQVVTEMAKVSGYDGVVDGHIYAVFESDQIKSAVGNSGGFSLNDPSILLDQAKAFVRFSADGRAVVALMQKGDFSSLIHETAHVFRRTLSEKDNETVIKWTRSLGHDVSLSNGRFIGPDAIKAEEAFARGYERFVREGKSPVKALSMVFEKIKEWMHRTYQAVKGSPIDVKLNPDIEAVFANMTTPKAWMDEAKPTIMGEKIAPAMTAQDWLATRLSRAGVNMTGADIERRLAAGETIELPFKVFGRNEISEEDLAKIQSSLDRVSALQATPADITVPFDNIQQSVVEPTLVGELQSTMSAGKTLRDDQAVTRKGGRLIGRAASAVLAGADALKNERIFSPRLRELTKEGERILNQRIGDFNVLMRDASRSLSYQHLFDYMTGAEVKFSIGGRRPLSAGHDAVDEASQILQAQHGKLTSDTSIEVRREYLGSEADMPATGWLGKDGSIVTDIKEAAPPSQVIGDVATLAFDAGAIADRDARGARLAAFFGGPSGPARLRQVRLSAIHMMESSPFLRHLAAAMFDTSDLDEARTAAEIIGTVAPDRILAYLEAVYKLAGGKIDVVEVGRRGLVFDPDMTSQEKVGAFFNVLTREKFGPVAVNRALSVVNVFGSQKTVYNRVADIGMTFSGDQRKAFRNFLNGGFTTPQEYEAGLRMFGEFGFNYNALDEAAKIAGSVKSTRYMPNNVQRQIGRALGRALDESTEVEKKIKGSGGKVPQFIKSAMQAVQSMFVRGRYIPKAAKVWMDLLDTGVMSGAVGGFSLGTESVVRQVLQSAFVSVQGHAVTKLATLGHVKTNQIREALQWASDQLVDRVTGRTFVASVNDTLIGANKVIRLPDGRRYTYSDLLQTAIANGVVASFETSELSENVRKAIEVGLSRRVFPAAVADAADWTSEQKEVWIKANSELFETWAERERIGVMLGLLHRGATPEQAARLTVKALFDYPGSLADVETKGSWSGLFLSLAQPYWTWQKNINHFLINALEEPAVQYRLGVIRRANDLGPEAVSQALYTVMVDPYGFDLDKMNPEERRLYFYLRAAYEESLGKESWQMSEEERLTFAAALWATHFQASETMVDGKLFHLSPEDAREVERRLKGSTAAMTLAENYVPQPNVGNVPDYQRGRIRAVLPFRNTDAMLDYIRNTDQQDLMMSLVFYEPGPIGGYNYLINASKLMWGLASMPAAMMTEQPVVNETMTTRYLDGLVDPERMPLVSETIVFLQGGSKTRLAEPVANMFRASDVTDRLLVYRKMDPALQESYDRDVANGVDPREAGRRYGQVIYANPLVSVLFNTTPLYDLNRVGRQLETRGAFSRDNELADIRKVLLLSGLLSDIGEVSQRKTEERTVYEIPKKAMPR